MALNGAAGVDRQSTPKKRDGRFFSKPAIGSLPYESPCQSFIFRNTTYASPTMALEAYILSELGEGTLLTKEDAVENLLLSGASGNHTRNSGHRERNRNASSKTENKKWSIHEKVDEAYRQLQLAKKRSSELKVHDVLSASEATLNRIAVDNLSSVPSLSESQLSTASTSSLLPNAPDVVRDETSRHLLPPGERTRKQRRYELNSSLEQLKRSLNEKDKENLLASHLTTKALGTLAKLKREKSGIPRRVATSDSDDLSEKLQRLKDDLYPSAKKVPDPKTFRMSGKVKVFHPEKERSEYEHLIGAKGNSRKSRDDSYLFFKTNSRRKTTEEEDRGGNIKCEARDDWYLDINRSTKYKTKTEKYNDMSYDSYDKRPVRGSRSDPVQNSRPPSWVEDLANTEISSVVNLDTFDYSEYGLGSHGNLLEASSGPALSLDDLSASYARNKAPSRVLRGKRGTDIDNNFAFNEVFSKDQTYRELSMDDTALDRISLTTDDLCFAAPDASNLKSILRTPTQQGPRSRLSNSTDDLITESLQHAPPPPNYSPKSASPRQAVRFQINGDVFEKSDGENFIHKNQEHREYIRQLMKDIEDSESVVSSIRELEETKPKSSSREDQNLNINILEDLPSASALNYFAQGYDPYDGQFGYLEKIQCLLSTPSQDSHAEPALNASQNTEDVLNGDRSWERNSGPKCHNLHLQDGTAEDKNIIDQFLEDCKTNFVDPTLSGSAPPGTMEALKNMLFTVQTLVPSTEFPEQQENSFASLGELEKQPSEKKDNTVPADLRHLLASESNLENSNDKGNSLSIAMQHLDTLKTLMNSGRMPQMTSTPNK